MESVECDALIIGAGVIGLAIGARLASGRTVALVDSYPKFGQETSSRNSEVVHSGIYYPPASKKTLWCIRGRELLYDYCDRRGVPCRRTGKFVVATHDEEELYLRKLSDHCLSLGVPHAWRTGEEIMGAEPLIRVTGGVFLPETGIVDSHQLMASLEREFLEREGLLAYRHRVVEVHRAGAGFRVRVARPEGDLQIDCALVVNAAGLGAAELSNQALGGRRYEHRFCRGRYFSLAPGYRGRFQHLVYPVPQKDGLGTHVTVDIDGYARLGPDVDWAQGVCYEESHRLYDCDWDALRGPFLASVRKYCPSIKEGDLSPGLIGIRPKLFIDGEARPDFLVENHDGFIHCLGIESPGLTSSLAIAEEVARLAGVAA